LAYPIQNVSVIGKLAGKYSARIKLSEEDFFGTIIENIASRMSCLLHL